MSDLISKKKAYEVLTEYYHHKTEMQHKALKEALDIVPSAEPTSEMCWRCNCPKMASAELKSCGYWDAESKYCALNRPSAEPKLTTNLQLTCNKLATDCISRQDAIALMCKALHYNYEEGYAVTQMLALPSADIDLSDYSDRLWRKAYEQGKADAEPRWIPCERELPELATYVLVSHVGSVFVDCLTMENGDLFFWETGVSLPEEIRNLAWMPLPECYRG